MENRSLLRNLAEQDHHHQDGDLLQTEAKLGGEGCRQRICFGLYMDSLGQGRWELVLSPHCFVCSLRNRIHATSWIGDCVIGSGHVQLAPLARGSIRSKAEDARKARWVRSMVTVASRAYFDGPG